MAPRFVARQLSRPTGLGGRIIRSLMNRGNASLNSYAVEQLRLSADDRVLEIGFGGGVALPRPIREAAYVCGVDASPDVVKAATTRFANDVSAGRAEFRVGMVESLPSPDAAFDKALSVNTVYFWKSLESGAREIGRVLKPGGRVVLGFVPKARMDRMNMPADIFTPRKPDDVAAALADAGFDAVEVRKPRGDWGWMTATGVRT
ncbi:class I SAM-dependent methyltransferase [Phenylobacterium terrae]|uniref:Class I SAM-dependent methyltransferase n=1 Tax=Phenylobacterium terrae TaxID=2665495 RepID=A0ABW4N4G8_9CAUL